MSTRPVTRQFERYDAANAAAALIVLGEPERYPGGLQEWAELVAYRLSKDDPARYPELTQAWARRARELAFHTPNLRRDGWSNENRDELSDLRSWNRR